MATLAAGVAGKVLTSVLAAKTVNDAVEQRKTRKAMTKASEETPAILPDEEEQQRAARRRAATRFGRRGSGRASTVLSDGQTLGG